MEKLMVGYRKAMEKLMEKLMAGHGKAHGTGHGKAHGVDIPAVTAQVISVIRI